MVGISKDKSSAKRKRVEEAAKPVAEPATQPEKSEKKKKVDETPVAALAQDPVPSSTTTQKSEKRKREETPSAAPTKTIKETSSKANAQEKVGEIVSNGDIKTQKTTEPPHNMHLARRVGVVKCRVDLYKIPPQCIKFEPTKTHLYLDTFKFTKKYLLNIPYPEGVQVDTNVEATFDSGVLKCDFPILSDPNKPKDHDDVIAAREQIKEMKQKGIPIPSELITAAKLAKTKADKKGAESTTTPSASPAPKKAAKKVLSNKEKRQKEKAKRPLNEDGTPAPRPKKAKGEKKKKEFLANPEAALQMADQVNEQQEKDIQAKYDKEYAKLSYDTRKKIENKEKKVKLRELRKQELEKAIDKMPKKEKFTKKTATKVSFAEQE